ncbi:MAG: tol-pal system-associated acyl-CoA thioesterase, partial [Steroidobacter sp.]
RVKEFVFPCRVYWEDTDGGGVVYYANYLKFMERARTEWLRSLGFEQTILREQYGVLLVVARVEANFRRSARLDDLLQVGCRVIECGKASVSFEQKIYRGEGDELLLDGVTRVGCIDAVTFKPEPLPGMIGQALERYGR